MRRHSCSRRVLCQAMALYWDVLGSGYVAVTSRPRAPVPIYEITVVAEAGECQFSVIRVVSWPTRWP